jgi:hypothetical protein
VARKPRFYNTITANCTTIIYHMMKRIVGHLPLDYPPAALGLPAGVRVQSRGLDNGIR